MIYERMKYAHERRELVMSLDKDLPIIEANAAIKQKRAALLFRDWNRMPIEMKIRYSITQDLLREEYAAAQHILMRCIFYKAMREKNREEE